MTIQRWAAKSDKNQAAIVKQLRTLGFDVDIVRRPYDLVVTGASPNSRKIYSVRVEIKDKGGDLSPAEKKYHAEVRHPETLIIAYDIDTILKWFSEKFNE